MTTRFWRRGAVAMGSVALALMVGGGVTAALHAKGEREPFASADDASMTTAGARVYARQCAACHGRHLQGQPFWQVVDQDSGRRASALDETGRAWLHGDADLVAMIKFGRFPATPPDLVSHMPAFQDRLDDKAVLSVLAFVKSRWPVGTRVAQALRNPGHAGLPAAAAGSDWTFPGVCNPRDGLASSVADR